MLEGRGGSKGLTMVRWKAATDPEGLPWYTGSQGRIQRVYHGMLEGRGGSRGFTMVCWKAGADPEGLPWYAGRQGRIQRVYHGMLEGRGGFRGFTMVWWRAGAYPEGFIGIEEVSGRSRGLPWYSGKQGRIQRVYHGMLEGRGVSSRFTMVR